MTDATSEQEVPNSELSELKDTLQRLQAEFENYRKRVEKENQNLIRLANEDLITALLPLLDNFELALASKASKEELQKGAELIYAQLVDTLEGYGLQRIDCQGQFDPYKHEALLAQASDKQSGTILEELQKGYMLNDKIIRHSKVKISKEVKNGN